MPSYMFLIYEDVDQPNATSDEEWAQMMQAHTDWQEHVARSGSKVLDGAPLEPASTATSIRPGANGPIVTDGPFAETKEALGGYYVLECPDLDAALALAKVLPGQGVEVRPVIPTPA